MPVQKLSLTLASEAADPTDTCAAPGVTQGTATGMRKRGAPCQGQNRKGLPKVSHQAKQYFQVRFLKRRINAKNPS